MPQDQRSRQRTIEDMALFGRFINKGIHATQGNLALCYAHAAHKQGTAGKDTPPCHQGSSWHGSTSLHGSMAGRATTGRTSGNQATRHPEHGRTSREEHGRRAMGREEKDTATLRIWDPKPEGVGWEGEANERGTGVPLWCNRPIRIVPVDLATLFVSIWFLFFPKFWRKSFVFSGGF